MMVLYSPQVSDSQIEYSFSGEVITVKLDGITDTFDFSEFGEGTLQLYSNEPPFEPLFITSLPLMPILSARRENGVLQVELLKFISEDSPDGDKYPEWTEV
jgi:hypothetical protein